MPTKYNSQIGHLNRGFCSIGLCLLSYDTRNITSLTKQAIVTRWDPILCFEILVRLRHEYKPVRTWFGYDRSHNENYMRTQLWRKTNIASLIQVNLLSKFHLFNLIKCKSLRNMNIEPMWTVSIFFFERNTCHFLIFLGRYFTVCKKYWENVLFNCQGIIYPF